MSNLDQELQQMIASMRKRSAESSTSSSMGSEICSKCGGTGFILSLDEEGRSYADDCECREQMLLTRRLELAEIPEAFKDYTLGTFSLAAYQTEEAKKIAAQACGIVKNWIDNFDSMKDRGMGLYFHSSTKGSGKTRMAASVANYIMHNTSLQVRFITSTKILSEIQATWDDRERSESKLLNDLIRLSVLVIDDFGTEKVKDWAEQRFFQIINERYISNRPTIFTSNYSLDRLEYDDRITNRIKERTYQIAFPEESVRETIMKQNHEDLIKNIT